MSSQTVTTITTTTATTTRMIMLRTVEGGGVEDETEELGTSGRRLGGMEGGIIVTVWSERVLCPEVLFFQPPCAGDRLRRGEVL